MQQDISPTWIQPFLGYIMQKLLTILHIQGNTMVASGIPTLYKNNSHNYSVFNLGYTIAVEY